MPVNGYNPIDDPWYGASGNGPSQGGGGGGGGDVDLSEVESRLDAVESDVTGQEFRLTSLESKPKVFVGEVAPGEPGPYVQFESGSSELKITVDDGQVF